MSRTATPAGTRRRRAMDTLAIERAIKQTVPEASPPWRRRAAEKLNRDHITRSGAGRTLRVGGVKVR